MSSLPFCVNPEETITALPAYSICIKVYQDFARAAGLEPATFSLTASFSAIEIRPSKTLKLKTTYATTQQIGRGFEPLLDPLPPRR